MSQKNHEKDPSPNHTKHTKTFSKPPSAQSTPESYRDTFTVDYSAVIHHLPTSCLECPVKSSDGKCPPLKKMAVAEDCRRSDCPIVYKRKKKTP